MARPLSEVHVRRGALLEAMSRLGFQGRQESNLDVLIRDVTHTSEIEGEHLDAYQVRSSLARRLGMEWAGLPTPAREVDGVVEMMLDATQNHGMPLTADRVFQWHAGLFPDGWSGMYRIHVGAYRDDREGPMQVVSGPMGREHVHFEAPSAHRVPEEMARFFEWFNTDDGDPVMKAALAHLWFVTIHPMDDGNGRIGRAVMDMALAQADGTSQRYYSVTEQIFLQKRSYYEILERTQSGNLNVTDWLLWFLECLDAALANAENTLAGVRRKQAFWERYEAYELSERQTRVLNRLLDGFQGHLQTAKYAKLAKCSLDTALRDLTDLTDKGILVRTGAGRSTRYDLP